MVENVKNASFAPPRRASHRYHRMLCLLSVLLVISRSRDNQFANETLQISAIKMSACKPGRYPPRSPCRSIAAPQTAEERLGARPVSCSKTGGQELETRCATLSSRRGLVQICQFAKILPDIGERDDLQFSWGSRNASKNSTLARLPRPLASIDRETEADKTP